MASFADIVQKIQKIPTKTRAIGFFSLVGVLVVLYIWQVHIPKNSEVHSLEENIASQQAKMRDNDNKIKKLDDLRAEVTALRDRLKVLTEQLPPESEVSGLLRQIQTLVNQSGLSLKIWRPASRRTHPSGLYEEIPMNLTLVGGYHNTAMFFDRVSKLTRIVNMLNIKMGGARQAKSGATEINITCTAMTFAASEKKLDASTTKKVSK